MTILTFPRRRSDRYDLRSWSDGYAIYDHGQLVATFHGPQFDLAGRVLMSLRAEDKAARMTGRA